ncbi:carboxypeptidase regulatory-like domain-containing protein [Aureitalea sp. L0-47]|uniref:carboxypeptidase-like regulatory domain-containing protein n=1 Tax=Aureitalea sp. L0-47 TaxID=2816962 RepID=UPI002238F83E|nr:carboxypeptidase-like regulatory domain-containing protein [Aureitalea sp. L0-47]MCW5519261.1 carboxypeptidase regulatory-like domain-containing protein [Aureitalea sp. L0-47]
MKRSLQYIAFVSLAFLLVYSCNEDKIGENEFGTLTGKVVVSGSNAPLENVRISTNPVSSTVFTDSSGTFIIENIVVGEYSVEARKEGYIADFEPATINGNVSSNVVFELDPSTANNRPPSAPELITPMDNEVLQSIEAMFSWNSTDPEGDPIIYTLELRNVDTNETMLFENLTDTTLTYSPLTLGTSYVWQVTATDEINDPVISPVSAFEVIAAPVDNRVLFVRKINGNNVIFSADENGDEFQLTSSEVNSYRPRRNVRANKIAYLQNDGSNVDIFIMDRDGSNKRKITGPVKPNGFNLEELDIDWPEDRVSIYYPRFDKLYRVQFNGLGTVELYQTPDGSLISEVVVSETSDLIVLKTNNLQGYDAKIFTINEAGTVIDTVIDGVDGAVGGLDLSIDDQKILYSYDVSGFENEDYRQLDTRLFIYDRSTMETTDVSDNKPAGTIDLDPIFAPNEAFVIFTNTSNDGLSQRNVLRLDLNTQDTREVRHEDAFMPDWQ